MANSRAALGCLIASVVFGIVFHPRVFFGYRPAARVLFIRASPDEVWRWTNALDLDAIKSNTFVLRSNSEKR